MLPQKYHTSVSVEYFIKNGSTLILERLMHNHLNRYLKEDSNIYEKQSGFQSRYSTNAIVQLVDKILHSMKKSSHRVFIDLSKAFNTADHSILLKKLKLYNITDKNIAWSESYLSNRKYYIQIGKIDLKHVTWGIPQGSILRPRLYLVYVNDLPNACC